MKALIIYDSTFGNTEHIAQAIAQKLREYGPVQLVPVEEAGRLELKETQLLLLGCPTQRYDLTPAVRAFLENIPRGTLQGVMAAAFDTRYRMSSWLSGSAAWDIAQHLQEAGATLILPPESFFVAGIRGPLDEGEIERAMQWATTLLERFYESSSVKGSRGTLTE
jgi:flavodoxin